MKFLSISKIVHHRLKSMSFRTNLQRKAITTLWHLNIIITSHNTVYVHIYNTVSSFQIPVCGNLLLLTLQVTDFFMCTAAAAEVRRVRR